MRSPWFWYVLLVIVCIVGPYVLGIPPRGRRDWAVMTAALGFLTWLLGGFAFVR
jgi:hypothetical protein